MPEFPHVIPAWIELVFLAVCIGTLVCRLWVLDGPAAAVPSQEKIPARLRLLFGVGTAVIIACTIADLLIGAAEMSGGPLPEVVALLPTVILKTHFGRVWLVRVAALLLLLVTTMAGRRHPESRGVLFFMLALGTVIAMTESASGHASDAGDFSMAEIMDWLHILAASVWGGGLIALAAVILPMLIQQDARSTISRVAVGFSRLAGYAVGVLALTALYNGRLYAGSFEALWITPYGWSIIAKIFLFALLVTLGAYNRYVSVPLVKEWAGFSPDGSPASGLPRTNGRHAIAGRFLNVVRAEALLLTLALFFAALLRHEVPARHALHHEHAGGAGHQAHMHYALRQDAASVRLETDPAAITADVPVSITVRLKDRKGGPLQGLMPHHERILHAVIIGNDLIVFAHIHPEDLGAITSRMLDTAALPLRFTFPKAGKYLVGLDFATQDGVYSKTASLLVSGRPGMGGPKIDLSQSKNFGPYRVTLATFPEQIKTGEETTLKYAIRDHGEPVKDLEPYLGAAMHLSVVRSDLARFMHTHGTVPGGSQNHHDPMHPMAPEKFGPEIDADVVFPAKGVYKIFSQVKRQGKVLLFDFMVEVQ